MKTDDTATAEIAKLLALVEASFSHFFSFTVYPVAHPVHVSAALHFTQLVRVVGQSTHLSELTYFPSAHPEHLATSVAHSAQLVSVHLVHVLAVASAL